MSSICENLKTLRNLSGMSQTEAAEALNVTRQTISSYETGRTQPDLEMLKRMADLYKTDINGVLYGSDRTQRNLRILKKSIIAISTVLLLCLIIRSVIMYSISLDLIVKNGMVTGSGGVETVRKHIALRDAADKVAGCGNLIFQIGVLVLIRPLCAMRKTYSPAKMLLWPCGMLASELAVSVIFMKLDGIYGKLDYITPVLSTAPAFLLLFILFAALAILKQRRTKTKKQTGSARDRSEN